MKILLNLEVYKRIIDSNSPDFLLNTYGLETRHVFFNLIKSEWVTFYVEGELPNNIAASPWRDKVILKTKFFSSLKDWSLKHYQDAGRIIEFNNLSEEENLVKSAELGRL
jgi:hypothetical protein